jgi:hypothetical protein
MKDEINWKSPTMALAEFLDDNFGFEMLKLTDEYDEEGDVENCYRWVQDNINEEDIKGEVKLLLHKINK